MPRLIPPPPRMPRIAELPPEEQTPVTPSGAATVVSAAPDSGATVKLGRRSVHVGTATIVAVIAAAAAAFGGRATAVPEAPAGLADDLRELRKDIRYIRVRVDRIEDRLERAPTEDDHGRR